MNLSSNKPSCTQHPIEVSSPAPPPATTVIFSRDFARTPPRERSAGDGGLGVPVMKRRRFALKANRAGRSVCAASANADVQTGFKGELLFYSKRLLEPLKQQRGFGSRFNLLVFLREKSRKTRRFESSQHCRASAASARVNAEAFFAIFMLSLSLFCLRRQIGSVPMQRILKT